MIRLWHQRVEGDLPAAAASCTCTLPRILAPVTDMIFQGGQGSAPRRGSRSSFRSLQLLAPNTCPPTPAHAVPPISHCRVGGRDDARVSEGHGQALGEAHLRTVRRAGLGKLPCPGKSLAVGATTRTRLPTLRTALTMIQQGCCSAHRRVAFRGRTCWEWCI